MKYYLTIYTILEKKKKKLNDISNPNHGPNFAKRGA